MEGLIHGWAYFWNFTVSKKLALDPINDPDIISDPLREFIFNINIDSLFVKEKPLACLGEGLKKLHW